MRSAGKADRRTRLGKVAFINFRNLTPSVYPSAERARMLLLITKQINWLLNLAFSDSSRSRNGGIASRCVFSIKWLNMIDIANLIFIVRVYDVASSMTDWKLWSIRSILIHYLFSINCNLLRKYWERYSVW